MERLPYIDEHDMEIGASKDEVWQALTNVLERDFGGSAPLARILGCVPADATPGKFVGDIEQTVPGFRVAESEVGDHMILEGRHRFSNYRLSLHLGDGCLTAETHAEFPGVAGRIYRAGVIGTGAHKLMTRRILSRVAKRTAKLTGQ